MNKKSIIIILLSVGILIGLLAGTRQLILGGATPVKVYDKTLSGAVERSVSGLKGSDINVPDVSIKSTKYSKDKQWALVYITAVPQNAADPAYVVVQKQPKGDYKAILGPGTEFDMHDLEEAKVPAELITALFEVGMIRDSSKDTKEEDHLH